MDTTLFEDDKWRDFAPIATTRHLGEQLFGARPVFRYFSAGLGGEVSLLGRNYLAGVVKERTRLAYNDPHAELFVNARLDPLKGAQLLAKRLRSRSRDFAIIDGGDVAVISTGVAKVKRAIADDGTLSQRSLAGLAKGLERLETPESVLFSFPWEILARNGEAITMAAGGAKGGSAVSPGARVEDFVSLDSRSGPIIIEDEAEVESFSRLSGPCFVGRKAKVRSALIRAGTSIGEGARVGGEVEESIIYPYSNKAHEGYLANSIVGEWVNIGAGAVTSNLKNTYGTVRVSRGRRRVETGMTKFGTLIGDLAKVSIGTMIYAGKTVGVGAHCSGTVNSDVPDFSGFGPTGEGGGRVRLDSVLNTQERMKLRREMKASTHERALIRYLYASSR